MENDKVKHLEYFKVENFKGLESFELNDVKQFNLILGDNNIGKTSVLEALLFDELPYQLLGDLHEILTSKSNIKGGVENVNYLEFFMKNETLEVVYTFKVKTSERKKVKLKLIRRNDLIEEDILSLKENTLVDTNTLPSKVLSFTLNDIEKKYTLNYTLHRIKNEDSYFPFIKAGLSYENDLVDFFSKNINANPKLKKEFIDNLQILSDDIYDITIDTTTIPDNQILLVIFKDDKKPIPLFMMGDGTIKLVRLILEVIVCKNARLMIDEIDNGLHFSRMKEVWSIVLKIAVKNNTQLFITTHDAECLRAFKEVLETEEMNALQADVASFTLFKNKNGLVDSVNYNFDQFEHAIDYSLNIRG